MSTRIWRLEPLEFVVLWEQFGLTRMPYPLQHRATATLADEHHRDRTRAATSVRQQLDLDLYRAVAILAEPETSCAAYGLDLIGMPDEQVIRVQVGIRGRAAALARQLPGHADDAGGPIRIELTSSASAPAKFAAALPKRMAGKDDVLVSHPSDLTGGALLADAAAKSTRERLRAMRARTRLSAGEVTICRGHATTPATGFAWHDCDDGRYLVEHDPHGHVTIRPGSPTVVAACIRTALTVEPQKDHQ